MTYNVEATDYFEKQLKRLLKKYPSLKKEISALVDTLETNPESGTPLGQNCYKIRLAVASKGKGKSAAQESLRIYMLSAKLFTCYQFTISPNKLIYLHQFWRSY